ncbi:MAG: uracil-DNA glycosylase [Candidatus Saccharibacteria bacterium]|nr:uracil-DNA glycosylase [Candidatus Saccharibacteria bacterium]
MSTLDKVYAEIVDDSDSEWAKKLNYLPVYSASEQAKIMIVGQAPGRKAQESMKPWNDVSGVKLRSWLGVSDEQFYNPDLFALVPMDFFYPGKGAHGDLPPRKNFAAKWHPKLLELMPNIQLIILVGSYAQKHYLAGDAKTNLTQTVLAYEEYLPTYLPLVHPSPLNFRWLSKNPWFETELVPILKEKVASIINVTDNATQ